MDAPDKLKAILVENRSFTLVEDDIYSTLPDNGQKHLYDKRARIYDLVVSTRLYNLLMWGSSPLDYRAFAEQAVTSHSDGIFLDAGCGSMLFTANIYADSNRQIIAFDQSLSMLRLARKRLINLTGGVPEHILLLQADLNDLPFRDNCFQTILCLNVLHLYENAAPLLLNFKRLIDDGNLYLTSLISNNRFVGDHYLKALYRVGEFVHPRSQVELKEISKKSVGEKISFKTKGNMAFVTAGFS